MPVKSFRRNEWRPGCLKVPELAPAIGEIGRRGAISAFYPDLVAVAFSSPTQIWWLSPFPVTFSGPRAFPARSLWRDEGGSSRREGE
jgi:hypothetical protein